MLRLFADAAAKKMADAVHAKRLVLSPVERKSQEISNPKSGDDSFDLLVNIWLKYQTISGHLWARSGYYQQSGAYGFRDQLQASQIWLVLNPQLMLQQIRLHARHQFSDGTALHWWHALSDEGLAGGVTDDLLWLPFMTARYLNETADYSVLGDQVPYYVQGRGTLQEHCITAIEKVLSRFSGRGLPLIGSGDWCDGFNAVGINWRGESIWLGIFLHDVLSKWAAILAEHSPLPDTGLSHRFAEKASSLKKAINTYGWNGKWYIAATTDTGLPVGDPSADDCQIYLNTQTWAILSGVADEERKQIVTDAVLRYLECDNGLMLCYPAFRSVNPDIGYITDMRQDSGKMAASTRMRPPGA
jgi:cellobiose phosphorylase